MFRPAPRLGQHLDDVAQGLLDLADEIVGLELLSAFQPMIPPVNTIRPAAATPLE